MKLCQNDQPMSRLCSLNLRLIGLKLWIFSYWPIFWLVSFFSLQTLASDKDTKKQMDRQIPPLK